MGNRPTCPLEVTNSALDGGKLRRNSLLCSSECTGGLYPSEQAVPLGPNAWSNGNSAHWGRVPTPLESSLSVHLAEFLRFARLGPDNRIRASYLSFSWRPARKPPGTAAACR